MLRLGILLLTICGCMVVLALVLDHFHAVVFGPCAGPGAVTIYLILIVTSVLGVCCTSIGGILWLLLKLRRAT